jgi:hypothetical protein
MEHTRLAVNGSEPKLVAEYLGGMLNLEFQARDSAYWGDYWLAKREGEVRIFFNQDPMHLRDSDPPHEHFVEADFPTHHTLIDIDGNEELARRVTELILLQFPGSAVVLKENI